MSNKVKNPNEKSNGFLWALLIVLLLAVGLVGYIVVSGKSAKQEALLGDYQKESVAFEAKLEDGAVVLKSDKATDSTPVVDLYEDFSCPACASLAEHSDADMKKAIEDGKLVVNVRSLNFLDRGNNDGHSTRAGTSAQKLASAGEAEAYWNYRVFLMQQQSNIQGKWGLDDFANAATKLGSAESTVNAIKEGNQDDYLKATQANSKKLEGDIGNVSSPHVIYKGEDVPLENWVETVVSG